MLNNAKSVITSVLGGHAIQLTAIDHAIAEFTQNSDTRKAVKMLFDVAAARAKYIPSDDTAVVAFKQLLNSVFLDVIDLGYKLKDMSVCLKLLYQHALFSFSIVDNTDRLLKTQLKWLLNVQSEQ